MPILKLHLTKVLQCMHFSGYFNVKLYIDTDILVFCIITLLLKLYINSINYANDEIFDQTNGFISVLPNPCLSQWLELFIRLESHRCIMYFKTSSMVVLNDILKLHVYGLSDKFISCNNDIMLMWGEDILETGPTIKLQESVFKSKSTNVTLDR